MVAILAIFKPDFQRMDALMGIYQIDEGQIEDARKREKYGKS